LEVICLKCLRKEPERRYESAAALADDLERWRRGEPIAARPVGRVERLLKRARRNPLAASALAAASLLLLALVSVAVAFTLRLQTTVSELGVALDDVSREKNATAREAGAARQAERDARKAEGEANTAREKEAEQRRLAGLRNRIGR